MATESGWLIERRGASGAEWLRVVLYRNGTRFESSFVYTNDANLALRFARREDAEAFMVLHPADTMLATPLGHMWIDMRPAVPLPAVPRPAGPPTYYEAGGVVCVHCRWPRSDHDDCDGMCPPDTPAPRRIDVPADTTKTSLEPVRKYTRLDGEGGDLG